LEAGRRLEQEIDALLGQRVKDVRLTKDLRAEDLDLRGEYSTSSMRLLEAGESRHRSHAFLTVLSRALGETVEDLLSPLADELQREEELKNRLKVLKETARKNYVQVKKRQGVSHEELAPFTKYGSSYLSFLQKGQSSDGTPISLSPDDVDDFARGLDVAPEEIWPAEDLTIYEFELKEKSSKESSSPVQKVGGIDLNPANLNLQIKRDGNGVPLPLNLQPIEAFQIDGFVPVIIQITPVYALPLLSKAVNESPIRHSENDKDERPFPMAYLDKNRLNLN